MEEASEEQDKDKRKREEEKSGQTNYYVHCCWNVSPFSEGGYFFQNVFIPDFCVLQPTTIETRFHIFSWLNIAQISASIVLMQEDGERMDHQLDWLLHFLSISSFCWSAAAKVSASACTVPPSVQAKGFIHCYSAWMNE